MTKLYEANNHILIHTGSLQPAAHSHMAAHIILSMGGGMKVQCAGEEYLCHGILLPSGASHAVDTCGNRVLVFLYDCTTQVAKQIRKVACIPEEICKEIAPLYMDTIEYRKTGEVLPLPFVNLQHLPMGNRIFASFPVPSGETFGNGVYACAGREEKSSYSTSQSWANRPPAPPVWTNRTLSWGL